MSTQCEQLFQRSLACDIDESAVCQVTDETGKTHLAGRSAASDRYFEPLCMTIVSNRSVALGHPDTFTVAGTGCQQHVSRFAVHQRTRCQLIAA